MRVSRSAEIGTRQVTEYQIKSSADEQKVLRETIVTLTDKMNEFKIKKDQDEQELTVKIEDLAKLANVSIAPNTSLS